MRKNVFAPLGELTALFNPVAGFWGRERSGQGNGKQGGGKGEVRGKEKGGKGGGVGATCGLLARAEGLTPQNVQL